jgi:hypothetical protein
LSTKADATTACGALAEATDVARISPLAHAHVIPSGTYHFERAATAAAAAARLSS